MARMLHILIAAIAICAALAAPASAESMTVDCGTDGTDSDELQDGLAQAVDGDVITAAEGSVCFGGFVLPSGRSITLQGAGTGATLDGSFKGNTQILFGDNPGTTTIRNLTFRNGSASQGGALQLVGWSPVTIEGNTFIDNSAGSDGGAVFIDHYLPLRGGSARGGELPTHITLRNNVFGGDDDGNDAFGRGGAVWVFSQYGLHVHGNEFDDNAARRTSGGGLYANVYGSLELVGNTFTGNSAGAKGGGASFRVCDHATVSANTFTGNVLRELLAANHSTRETSQSPRGAGLHAQRLFCKFAAARHGEDDFQVLQTGNRFTGNVIEAFFDRPHGLGAGEAIEDLDVHSTDDRYVGNRIDDFDGEGGGLSIERARVFEGNNLVAAANRIVAQPEQNGSRGIAEPVPSGRGGGISMSRGEVSGLNLFNATIVENVAADGSGIAGHDFDTLTLHNSIAHPNHGAESEISGFALPQQPERGAPAGTRDVRYSIACQGAAAHPGEANQCVDPKLVAPAQGDVHQTTASPSLDAGSNPLTTAVGLTADYEGDARIINRVDMGADEVKPPAPVTTAPTPAAAAPQGAVLGAQKRACVSRRAFRIRLRVPRGQRAVSATVRVNGKRVQVIRGRRLRAPVVLRGLPKGRFAVRITIRLANGRTVTGTRVYNTCRPRLPGDGPPQV